MIQKEKLIIIGSGPAGLTAGIYAARANLKPLIIEGNNPGGQLMGTTYVENWPGDISILGPELMKNITNHAKHFGTRFLSEVVTKIDFSKKPFTLLTSNNQELQTDAVILAMGTTARRLGCPGENEYWAKGVSTCAVCDGTFYANKRVLIVGGGDTAMEEAAFMTNYTSHITIVHILDKLTASYAMQQKVVHNKNISIIYSSTVKEIKGDGTKVTSVVIENQKTKQVQELPMDGIFLGIGLIPQTALVKGQINLTPYGYVALQGHANTSVPGVFVAGDIADPLYRQAIAAAGSGCMAALDAERYLHSLETA